MGYSSIQNSPIYDKGTHYQTAEHLFQAVKCEMAGDAWRRNLVLCAPTSLEAKRVGDQITESDEWKAAREDTLKHITDLKFDQNAHLCEILLATGDKPLYEATNNSYYRIGATLHSRELRDRSFKGANKLGIALMNKRTSLRPTPTNTSNPN